MNIYIYVYMYIYIYIYAAGRSVGRSVGRWVGRAVGTHSLGALPASPASRSLKKHMSRKCKSPLAPLDFCVFLIVAGRDNPTSEAL